MIKSFLLKYFIYTLIILLLSLYPVLRLVPAEVSSGIMLNFIVFFILVIVSALIIIRSISRREINLFNTLMISMAVKMLIAVVYFWIAFPYYQSELIFFTLSFFIYYLVFSIFEVSFLVRFLNKNK